MEGPTIDISSGMYEDSDSQLSSIIRVIGVGGAGGNAVNNMYEVGIEGVNYIVCNTDKQALENSPVPIKIQLGKKLTEGLGAGNNPERGRESAIEALDEIKEMLKGAKMVFVTAGMGGGTGTGAAPVIAKTAKDMDILTIGIVSIPYKSEGKPRIRQAIKGLKEMATCVDSLLVINSERLIDMYGDLPLEDSLKSADNVLAMAAKGLAEIITIHAIVNVDYADLRTAMKDSGVSVIGTATASGENRAIEAVQAALDSPLLNNSDIRGAKFIIANMFSSHDKKMTQREMGVVTNYLREISGCEDDETSEEESLIWGAGYDDTLGDEIRVTIVATGFATDVIEGNKVKPVEKPSIKIDFEGEEENFSNSDEEEQPKTVSFPTERVPGELEKEIEILYKERQDVLGGNDRVLYSTKDLADPTIVSFDRLKSEEVISKIENVPAFIRRAGSKNV